VSVLYWTSIIVLFIQGHVQLVHEGLSIISVFTTWPLATNLGNVEYSGISLNMETVGILRILMENCNDQNEMWS